jgi:homogentisate 1,2-dioxygenase
MTQLYRNGDGDDMLFIHAGSGELFCDYGHLSYRDGDYILIPRSTNWRIEPAETTTMLLIEASNGAYQLPDKGIVGPHAILMKPCWMSRPSTMPSGHSRPKTNGRW